MIVDPFLVRFVLVITVNATVPSTFSSLIVSGAGVLKKFAFHATVLAAKALACNVMQTNLGEDFVHRCDHLLTFFTTGLAVGVTQRVLTTIAM